MPLISCPFCDEAVSPNAAACVYCGEPLNGGGGGPPVDCPMCGEENPPHAVECAHCGEPLAEGVGGASWRLWRDGKTLVMEKGAELPDRCVKSNAPADGRLKRILYWHHPALIFLLLAGCLIYIIVAMIVQKRATIHIGLSDEWFAKRRRATLFGWLSVLVAIGMLIGGIVAVDKRTPGGGFIIFGAVLIGLFGAIFGLVGARMVYPKRITDTHVWRNGVCPAYLDALPEWRGGY